MALLDEIGAAFRGGISDGYRQAAREAENAKRRTNEWASGLKNIVGLVAGGAGVLGIADAFKTATKAVAEFTTTAIALQSFATDTRLAASQVLQFQQAGARMGLTINDTNKTIGGLSNILQDLGSRGTVGSAIFQDVAKMGPNAIALLRQTERMVRSGDMAGGMKNLLAQIAKLSPELQFEWARILGIQVSTIQDMNGALERNVQIWPRNTAEAKELHQRWIDLQTVWDNVSSVVLGKVTAAIYKVAESFGTLKIKQKDVEEGTTGIFDWLEKDIAKSLATFKQMKDDIEAFVVWVEGIDKRLGEAAAKARAAALGAAEKIAEKGSRVGPEIYGGQEPTQKLGPAQPEHPVDKLLRDALEGAGKVMQELIGIKPAMGAEGGRPFDTGRFEMAKAVEEGTTKALEKVLGTGGGGGEMLGLPGGFQFPGRGGGGGGFVPGRRGGSGGTPNIRYGGGGRTPGGWWTDARQQQAMDYLQKEGGLSEMGARGLVARWAGVESSGQGADAVNPSSGAAGIAQWLGSRKHGFALGDFEGQLKKAVDELNTSESAAGAVLRSAKTEAEGARGASMFERAEGFNRSTGMDNFTGATIGTMRKMQAAEARRRQEADAERSRIDKSVNAAKGGLLGRAAIDVTVKAPRGTITDASGDGVFQDISIKRLPQGADAGASNPSGSFGHQSFE